MLRIFNIWHSRRNISKRKKISDLLPSDITMNIQLITLHDKHTLPSDGMYFGCDSFNFSMLRYASSVWALSFGFRVCCNVVAIQALDSLQLCQASLTLKVVLSGFPTIFNTRPYAHFDIGFLTAPFTKPHLGLRGGNRR